MSLYFIYNLINKSKLILIDNSNILIYKNIIYKFK